MTIKYIFPLTIPTWQLVLCYLSTYPSLDAKSLSDKLHITYTHCIRILLSLESHHLIQRKFKSGSNLEYEYYCTVHGQTLSNCLNALSTLVDDN